MRNDGTGAPRHRLRLEGLRLTGHRPIDLTVEVGEVVALTGWDCSDLLWTIAGLARAESGRILVDGQVIAVREDALEAGVALIPEGGALASLLTAFENVVAPLVERQAATGRRAAAPRHAEDDPASRAGQALDSLGLADSADHLVEELSGGQQQRVALARAVAARPRLLLADQVTTDLDPDNRVRVVAVLRELARHGAAVVLASDDPAVRDSCDRTVVLD